MAARYFRNTGTGFWNIASNWSATDGGGATGAVPTASDDVFLTQNSINCNISSTSVCKSLNCTGYQNTLFGAGGLTISGNLIFSTGMTLNYNGTIIINVSSSINFANKILLGSLTFSTTSTQTLLSDINLPNGTLTFSGNGGILTFSGNNYNIYCNNLSNTSYGYTTILAGNLYINNSFNVNQSTNANKCLFKSNIDGLKRKIILKNTATMDLSFVNFTDIDAIQGLPIYTYKGIITNSDNVYLLTQDISQISKGNII